jgi:S1-C subfamily serine protease
MFKFIAGVLLFLFLMFPTIEKGYKGIVGSVSPASSSSKSWIPKSEINTKVNGVDAWDALSTKDGVSKAIGAK